MPIHDLKNCSQMVITKKIKERLRRYTDLLREIDNQSERLEHIKTVYGLPSGTGLTGMPRAKGGISDTVSTDVERKTELEEKIRKKKAEAETERTVIERMTDLMTDPDERLIIQLKYIDRAEWSDVTFVLFGNRPDYIDKLETYQRRTYRIHDRALISLAKIMEEVTEQTLRTEKKQ